MARSRTGMPAALEQSAGGVVLRRIAGRVQVLLIRDPYSKWGLPKGHLEEGEKASEAAAREVEEETGLSGLVVGPQVARTDWYFHRKGRRIHKFCTFFLIHSPKGTPVPEEEEGISECAWVPLDEAADRISYENAGAVVVEAREMLGSDPPPLEL